MEEKYIRPYSSRPGTWIFRFKNVRKFFRTKEDAIVARDAYFRHAGLNGVSGLLSASAVREYERAKELAGNVPLDDIVRDWLRIVAPSRNAPKVLEALDLWRERCEARSLSVATLNTYKVVASRFCDRFRETCLSEISERQLLDWYYSMPGSARSRRSILTGAVSFLGFCAENSWIESPPRIRKHQLEREVERAVEVFSVDEVGTILRVVEEKLPRFFPNFALRAYCGLRTAEAAKMRWEWIDFVRKRIVVPGSVCKTRDAWTLQAPNLPDKIFRVLEPFRQASGLLPAPYKEIREALMRELDFSWKHNGLRHTFCTMHISLYGDATRTATLLKHRGVTMLYRHYCGQLVSQQEAAKYFA